MSNIVKNAVPIKTYRIDRKIALAQALDPNRLATFISDVSSRPGVLELEFESGQRTLNISYDLYKLDIEEILLCVEGYDVPVRKNIFDRIKYNAWQFSDHNQKDILVAPIHCCNKSPK